VNGRVGGLGFLIQTRGMNMHKGISARMRTGIPCCGLRPVPRAGRDRGCGRGAMLRAPVPVRETDGSGRGESRVATARPACGLTAIQGDAWRHGSASIRAICRRFARIVSGWLALARFTVPPSRGRYGAQRGSFWGKKTDRNGRRVGFVGIFGV
jgi:hypothetical protein